MRQFGVHVHSCLKNQRAFAAIHDSPQHNCIYIVDHEEFAWYLKFVGGRAQSAFWGSGIVCPVLVRAA